MLKNIIKNIVKWKKTIILATVFLILSFVLINSIRNGKTTTINNKVFDSFTSISQIGNKIRLFKIDDSKSEIEKLKQENSSLRTELIKNKISEIELKQLEELKKALNFVTQDISSDYVSATVVAKNDGNYYKSFTVSAGLNQGVKQDSIVVNADGLIGRIYEVSSNYSKAISIMDNRFPISFRVITRTQDTGMISQDIKTTQIESSDLVKGYMFDANSKVAVGEILITSGLGLYPEGIPIGTVTQIVPDEQNILKYIIVKPFVDFTKIDKVIIFNKREI